EENEWCGLAMQLEIDCPGHPIHWLLEDTTWEIGGEANGAVLVQQDMTSIDLEQKVTKDNTFSTKERFFKPEDEIDVGDSQRGAIPIDMMPRSGGACILDFQAKDDLALVLFSEKPDQTRVRIEKFSSENVIHYMDRPTFAMTENAIAPERKLLVYRHPQKLQRHEWRNLWLDTFVEVRKRVHASYDFELEIPRPTAWAFMWNFDLDVYMEDWTLPLIDALPEYKRLGYVDLFTHGVFDGASNDPEYTGGNVCLNYDYKYCPEYGGPEAMKKLFDAAKEQGMRTWQWFGLYLIPRKNIPAGSKDLLQENPDWNQLNSVGEPFGGAGRMRSSFREYLFDCIKTIRDETGLEGAFWDSYQNTGLVNLDYRADDKAPHTEEIWRFQADLQKIGIHQRVESVSIFGISTIGIYGMKDDTAAWDIRRRWWENSVENDDLFAWLDCAPAFFSENSFSKDVLPPSVYFKFLAHRSAPTLSAFPWGPNTPKGDHVPTPGPKLPGQDLSEEYGHVNRMYNTALPFMSRMRIIEGGKYVLWLDSDNQAAVAWAFEDCEIEHSGPITDLDPDTKSEADGTASLKAGHAYLLGDR
ncbi:MAG: hypothetical protein HRT89_14885, partial [Lentisphaeria bacterium]|nr:hypothetical protein [Lentisphaeria bacterium]